MRARESITCWGLFFPLQWLQFGKAVASHDETICWFGMQDPDEAAAASSVGWRRRRGTRQRYFGRNAT